MQRAMLANVVILALVAGLLPDGRALGSIRRHSAFEAYGPKAPEKTAEASVPERALKQTRKISSYIAQMRQDVLAKLRPIERGEDEIDFDSATKALNSKTTLEKIYDKDFEKKMRGEYARKVAPHEQTANNPVWRPRTWEMNRYNDGRKDLAKWTAREVVEDQLHDFVNGGDKDSTPMKVLTTVREVTGGGDDSKDDAVKLTPEQKAARAHRRDLPALHAEEDKIPTKLRTKVNVIKGNGSVVFSNPIAITSVNGSGDGFSVEMKREFRKLSMRSNVTYGVNQECLNFNVNKKITEQVSVDLDHYAYTGGKRGANGEKLKEQARVNYSISF